MGESALPTRDGLPHTVFGCGEQVDDQGTASAVATGHRAGRSMIADVAKEQRVGIEDGVYVRYSDVVKARCSTLPSGSKSQMKP